MNRLLALLLLLFCGCASLRDSATDYVKDLAIEKITEAVDKQLDKRGLSLEQLRKLADDDRNGKVTAGEVTGLAKAALMDFVDLKVQLESDKSQAMLEEKLKAVAGAKDLDELRAATKDADLFGKGTLGMLVTAVLGFAYTRITSAAKHGKTQADLAATGARLDAMEKLTGMDLNRDGRIGSQGAVGASGAATLVGGAAT